MSSTHVPNGSQASPLNKGSDIKCVQTTKGWVCALCFPLGHPSRALERVLNLAELKSHASSNHYASLGEHEWKNYVNQSVYYEAQFRGQSSLGLNGGVMHGPPTIASQKTLANKAGVLKRKYVKKAKPVAETALDLMETMINFDGKTDAKDMIEALASPGGNQDGDSEMSDVESTPSISQACIGSFFDSSTAQHQHGMRPINTAQVVASPASLQTGTDPFYNQFAAQNQFSMHSMDVSQVATTSNTPHTGNSSYYDTSAANYGMHQMGVSQIGASSNTTQSGISSFNNPSTHLQFDMNSIDISQATSSPSKPSRKKAAAPKNPLRQRLSENPSFESAVSVHGLARVQAAGNAGLQRYLDRQARGLPRTSNIPLPLASPPPRNGTMGLPLTAANYAAAGMPNLHVEKVARRTKKVDRRRQASASLSNVDDAEDNNLTSTNPPPTNLSLNEFGVPAAIFGQAPGAVYKSHTYKSIYAESTPPKEQPPLPEVSLFDFSFSEFSHPPTNNEVVQQDPSCQVGTVGMLNDGQHSGFTDSFVSGLLDETFGAHSGGNQTATKHSGRDISRTLEPDQLFNDMGLDGISESFDFNAFVADSNYNFDDDSTVGNTIPQQNTGNFDEFFATAGIPKQNPAPQHNTGKFDDFFAAAGIPKTHDSELDAMFGFNNSSSPTNTNHSFRIFHTTSLEYGAAGLEAVKAAQAAVSAGEPLPPPSSTASSLVIGDSLTPATRATSPVVEASSADGDAVQASEDLYSATSTPLSSVAESWSSVESSQAVESPVSVESPSAAESTVVFEPLRAVELAVSVPVPAVPAVIPPEMADIITEQQSLLAAMVKRQEEQEAQFTAEIEAQKSKAARLGADAEATALHKADIQHQLEKQMEINEALTKQLEEQKDLHKTDILRLDAEAKARTRLNAESSATIERQASEIKKLAKQLAQQKAKMLATTTTKEPAVRQVIVARKPLIDTEKLLAAKKPVVPAEPSSAYFTNTTAYHGRKTTVPTNNNTSTTQRTRASRERAASLEPGRTPRRRAASPEEPAGDKKRRAGDKFRFSSGNEPRKNVPDGKGGRLCATDIEALAKVPAKVEEKIVKKTAERIPTNSLGIKGPLPKTNPPKPFRF
ncbi:hypothetical protein OCU04_005445 [Sclerotinia nivalis]|uniref:Uncharacterized protein n=1 Tax=Sclerotinia nivalis TaxID=352851 RepID=A0A9X0DMT9_9HELO|nr:hypothetical protein OCU04_005445 [Sclerotinia nivalis]